jgi:hypothetical protein
MGAFFFFNKNISNYFVQKDQVAEEQLGQEEREQQG